MRFEMKEDTPSTCPSESVVFNIISFPSFHDCYIAIELMA